MQKPYSGSTIHPGPVAARAHHPPHRFVTSSLRRHITAVCARRPVRALTILAATAVLLSASGCGLLGIFSEECVGQEPGPPEQALSPLAHALRYLEFTQAKTDSAIGYTIEYAGNWPQCSTFEPGGPFIREISPFAPAFIHHALTLVTEDTRAAPATNRSSCQRSCQPNMPRLLANGIQAQVPCTRKSFSTAPVALSTAAHH